MNSYDREDADDRERDVENEESAGFGAPIEKFTRPADFECGDRPTKDVVDMGPVTDPSLRVTLGLAADRSDASRSRTFRLVIRPRWSISV